MDKEIENIRNEKVTLTKRGNSKMNIYKKENFKKFKEFVEMYKLPVLERKWKYYESIDN